MTESERNFWRYWTPRAAPLGVVFGMIAGTALCPLAAVAGLTVAVVVMLMAVSLTTTLFVVLLGQAKIRAVDRMLTVFPERARCMRPGHHYEPPVPVRLDFDSGVDATTQMLAHRLVRHHATQVTDRGLVVDLRELERENPNHCRLEAVPTPAGTELTVHPDNRLVIGARDERATRFYDLVARLEELGGRLRRVSEWGAGLRAGVDSRPPQPPAMERRRRQISDAEVR